MRYIVFINWNVVGERENKWDEDGAKRGVLRVMMKDFNLIYLNLKIIEVMERFWVGIKCDLF